MMKNMLANRISEKRMAIPLGFVFVCLFFLSGCRHSLDSCDKMALGDARIVNFAKAYAANWRDLSRYQEPTVRDYKGHRWISFEGKDGQPGNHFTIKIDLKTCQASFWPGA